MGHVIRSANRKTYRQIYDEIDRLHLADTTNVVG
jgi:hypothetical protein